MNTAKTDQQVRSDRSKHYPTPLWGQYLLRCLINRGFPIHSHLKDTSIPGHDGYEEMHAIEVTEIGNNPILHEVPNCDSPIEGGNGHEHDVAGKKVAAAQDYHHEADGEESDADGMDETRCILLIPFRCSGACHDGAAKAEGGPVIRELIRSLSMRT